MVLSFWAWVESERWCQPQRSLEGKLVQEAQELCSGVVSLAASLTAQEARAH